MVTAAGAGFIGSTAFSAAAAIAPEDHRGRALAVVMGGLVVSTALGLPIGTLIGSTDWRLTLWTIAGLGLVAGAGVALWLPKISLPEATFRDRLMPLKEPWILAVLAVTVTALAGIHLLYTYIAPALENATGGSQILLTIVLLVWGLGAVIGNAFVGRLSDRHSPERVLVASLFSLVLILAISPVATVSMTASVVWAAIWGVCIALPVVPQQHRLVTHAPTAAPLLLALNSSAIYLGIAIGGGLGGIAQVWIPPARLGVLAAGLVAVAFVLALLTLRRTPEKPSGFSTSLGRDPSVPQANSRTNHR